MAKPKELPSQEYLQSIFDYNPETGMLIWKEREGNNKFNIQFAGKEANSIGGQGYYRVNLDNTNCLAHRIIWKLLTGNEPNGVIDHINQDRLDNRFENLRDVSESENAHNRTRMKQNQAGIKGVYYDNARNRYYGCIRIRGNRLRTKRYETIEEAAAALEVLKSKNHDHLAAKPIKAKSELTLEYLRDTFRYEDGNLIRITDNSAVGTIENYVRTSALGKSYLVHRLIYWLCTGIKPKNKDIIDHIDGDKLNNKIENLRLVTHRENSINSKVNKNSKSGVTGVYFLTKDNRWVATIRIEGKTERVGTFRTKEEAIVARQNAEKEHYGEFTRNS